MATRTKKAVPGKDIAKEAKPATPEVKACIQVIHRVNKLFEGARDARDNAVRIAYTSYLPYMDERGLLYAPMYDALMREGYVPKTGPKPEDTRGNHWGIVARASIFGHLEELKPSQRSQQSQWADWLEAAHFFNYTDPVALLNGHTDDDDVEVRVKHETGVDWKDTLLLEISWDGENNRTTNIRKFLDNYRAFRNSGKLTGPSGTREQGFERGREVGASDGANDAGLDLEPDAKRHGHSRDAIPLRTEPSDKADPSNPSPEWRDGWMEGYTDGYPDGYANAERGSAKGSHEEGAEAGQRQGYSDGDRGLVSAGASTPEGRWSPAYLNAYAAAYAAAYALKSPHAAKHAEGAGWRQGGLDAAEGKPMTPNCPAVDGRGYTDAYRAAYADAYTRGYADRKRMETRQAEPARHAPEPVEAAEPDDDDDVVTAGGITAKEDEDNATEGFLAFAEKLPTELKSVWWGATREGDRTTALTLLHGLMDDAWAVAWTDQQIAEPTNVSPEENAKNLAAYHAYRDGTPPTTPPVEEKLNETPKEPPPVTPPEAQPPAAEVLPPEPGTKVIGGDLAVVLMAIRGDAELPDEGVLVYRRDERRNLAVRWLVNMEGTLIAAVPGLMPKGGDERNRLEKLLWDLGG